MELLEEGEISDDTTTDIDPYIPLKRPKVNFEPPSTTKCENETNLMDEDNEISSHSKSPKLLGSDSESDDDKFGKKLKISLPNESKKYSIWSKDPNEDLTDCLKQVDMVDDQDRSLERSVESYPLPNFQKKRSDSNKPCKFKRKRKQPDKKKKLLDLKYGSVDEIPMSLIASMESNSVNSAKITRNLDSLEVNESSTIEEVADDIANKLKEYNVQLILRIVIVLGKKKAFQFYEKTRVIEKLGGMLINNGSRRRTSGGVYIFLVRNDKELSQGQLNAIFEQEVEEKRCQRAIAKQRKKRKVTFLTNKKNNETSSELSNPPPSPDLPELLERKELILSSEWMPTEES